MQRNYLRGLLVCLIPCLLAGLFAVRLDRYKLGIDLAGGTILVYEINLERTKQRKEALGENTPSGSRKSASDDDKKGLTGDEMNELATQIKRRIDPTDIKNVTVRPLGYTRLEIILPIGGATSAGKTNLSEEEIQEVKRLISQMGVLEFRILANGTDDLEGIVAARAAVDSKSADALSERAKKGLAPESPDVEPEVAIGDSKAKARYVWVEIGQEERESLGLSNANEGSTGLWADAKRARDTGKTFLLRGKSLSFDNASADMVLFSRKCESTDELGKEEMDKKRLVSEGKSEEEAEKLIDRKKYEYFVLTRVSLEDALRVGGEITLTAFSETDKSFNLAIGFRFNGAGAQQFGKITRRNKPTGGEAGFKRSLAILLDDRIVSVANIISEITSQGQITGKFNRNYVARIVQILRSGALSAELKEKPVSENTIGPTLGKDTIHKGTLAVGVAFVAILVFMVVYYRFAGIVACIALFANLLLTIGFMVAVNAAFTLPGLAGLVLTLGMAVDANVLIYERLREERNKGANIITAIRNGYERAFPTIIDTHLTSIFTAIVLYTTGNDNLKGFAISLTVGLVISLFTSLFMTRLIFDFWQHKKWLTDLSMMRLFEKPSFRPMKYRRIFFTITGISAVLGLALFVYRGESVLNVDFRGGTVFAGKLKDGEERALTQVGDKPGFRELLSEENQKKRLDAVDARWENNQPDAKSYVYTITYADNSKTTVTLNNQPAGADDKEKVKDLVTRARQLPDVSVEQLFLSEEPSFPDGESRHFTIRTTEKQPELVRASLDRLLRDDKDNSLMAGATMTFEINRPAKISGTTTEITFWPPITVKMATEQLEAEFKELGVSAAPAAPAAPAPASFKLTPVGEAVGEKYTKMLLDVAGNPAFSKIASANPAEAADKQKQLELLQKIQLKLVGGTATLTFTKPTSMVYVQELLDREFQKIGAETGNESFKLDPVGDPENGRYEKMLLNVSKNSTFNKLTSIDNDATKKGQEEGFANILAKTKQSFDATPEPERLEVFDSQLAKETRTKAFVAIGLSWIAILVYLWFRFGNWTFGAAAVICLIHDLCFTLGAIAACHYLHLLPGIGFLGLEDFKIDLAAVAALLTLVGYSVSDTIVVFDRIREVRGKNPKLTPEMIDDSVNQTLSRTILTATTVFLVSIVLYIFGGEGVHLFAFVMVMGVLVGTYSSVFVAAPLLLIFGEGHDENRMAMTDESTDKEAAQEEVLEG